MDRPSSPGERPATFTVGDLNGTVALEGGIAIVTITGAWHGDDLERVMERLGDWSLPADAIWDLRGSRLRFMTLTEIGIGAGPVIGAVRHQPGATALVGASDVDVGLISMWAALLGGAMPRRRYHVTTSMDDAWRWLADRAT